MRTFSESGPIWPITPYAATTYLSDFLRLDESTADGIEYWSLAQALLVGLQVTMLLWNGRRGPSLILSEHALESAAMRIRDGQGRSGPVSYVHDQSAVNHSKPLHQISFAWTLGMLEFKQ